MADDLADSLEQLTLVGVIGFREIAPQVMEIIADETRQNFATETAPDGKPWAPLKGKHLAGKKKLVDKRDLLASVESAFGGPGAIREITAGGLVFGTSVPHAIFHHEGTRFMEQRRFLGVSESMERRIEEAVAEHAERQVADGIR